jgi:hypothetical protein
MEGWACAPCLVGGGRIHAVTVYNGTAVCRRHLAAAVAEDVGVQDVSEWQQRIDDAIERGWLDR